MEYLPCTRLLYVLDKMLTVFPFCVYMVPLQSLLPKINEHLPPEIRVIGESTYRTLIDLLESYTIFTCV